MQKNWFHLPEPETAWLVDGLISSDGHTSVVGKPKAGKSTLVRNLIASVIKSRPFIGRSVDIPEGTGKVIYIHLDRKDQPWRVAAELRQLGVTESEASRLILRTAQDIPDSFSERLEWLKKEVTDHRPHLLVIDLLWQFVIAENSNDYNAVLTSINSLQDSLTAAKYQGALVVTLHGRKATNVNDVFDDVLGSTSQRGSFSTNIMLTRHRKENVHTIQSDQTDRDEILGELPETVLHRNTDGTLSLLQAFSELATEEKQSRSHAMLKRVIGFIEDHPGCEMPQIMDGLGMAKKTILKLLNEVPGLWHTIGKGEKGDPLNYYSNLSASSSAKVEATKMEVRYAN